MPVTSTTAVAVAAEDEPKTGVEFTRVYNKWFRELVSIEENLLTKADQIQVLQNSLDSEADTLKRLNENLVETQLEQNYMEDLLNVLVKEQEELQREITKLEESTVEPSDDDSADHEECSALFATLDSQLKQVKESVKSLVENINSKDRSADSENPFPVYRTVLDHYADALQLLDTNTTEIQQKFNTLQEICLKYYIPTEGN